MTHLHFAIIGHGVMGEAILAGILKNKLAEPGQVTASGPLVARGDELRERYGIVVTTDNLSAARSADVVILSVKPQKLKAVLAGLKGALKPDALVISIVAGASLRSIQDGLGHKAVVRSMPNTPAQIGMGITVWAAAPEVTEEQRELTGQALGALGPHVYVEEENYLDMATAVSGTGPAYVFMFMEAMIDAGVHLGFPRRIAEQLVVQTLRGSVEFFDRRKEHPAKLRNEVTSPGGTSAAAIYYLEKAGFRTAISRAVWAAFERSQELGKGKESQAPEKE